MQAKNSSHNSKQYLCKPKRWDIGSTSRTGLQDSPLFGSIWHCCIFCWCSNKTGISWLSLNSVWGLASRVPAAKPVSEPVSLFMRLGVTPGPWSSVIRVVAVPASVQLIFRSLSKPAHPIGSLTNKKRQLSSACSRATAKQVPVHPSRRIFAVVPSCPEKYEIQPQCKAVACPHNLATTVKDLGNGQQLTWQETGLEKHACACAHSPPCVCSLMPILISPLQIQLLRSLTMFAVYMHFDGTETLLITVGFQVFRRRPDGEV